MEYSTYYNCTLEYTGSTIDGSTNDIFHKLLSDDSDYSGGFSELEIPDDQTSGRTHTCYADVPPLLKQVLEPHFKDRQTRQGHRAWHGVYDVNGRKGLAGWQVLMKDPLSNTIVSLGNCSDERVGALTATAANLDPGGVLRRFGGRNWLRCMIQPNASKRGGAIRKWIHKVQRGTLSRRELFQRRLNVATVPKFDFFACDPMVSWSRHKDRIMSPTSKSRGIFDFVRETLGCSIVDNHDFAPDRIDSLADAMNKNASRLGDFLQMLGYAPTKSMVDGECLFVHDDRASISMGDMRIEDFKPVLPELMFFFVFWPIASIKYKRYYDKVNIMMDHLRTDAIVTEETKMRLNKLDWYSHSFSSLLDSSEDEGQLEEEENEEEFENEEEDEFEEFAEDEEEGEFEEEDKEEEDARVLDDLLWNPPDVVELVSPSTMRYHSRNQTDLCSDDEDEGEEESWSDLVRMYEAYHERDDGDAFSVTDDASDVEYALDDHDSE